MNSFKNSLVCLEKSYKRNKMFWLGRCIRNAHNGIMSTLKVRFIIDRVKMELVVPINYRLKFNITEFKGKSFGQRKKSK
jgi:ribosomal protein L19